jgi:hypothetical protein
MMPGVSIYRLKPLSETIAFLEGSSPHEGYRSSTIDKAAGNKDNLLKLSYFLSQLKGEYFQRIERDIIDFYTNDPKIHSLFESTFSNLVRNSFVPRKNLLSELESNKYILCKKFPHNKYKFKIYLLPHKIKHNQDEKIRYVNWLKNNDKVSISDSTASWFIATNWYWDRRYIYVEDEQNLLLVRMRNPLALGRIYEYLICDK